LLTFAGVRFGALGVLRMDTISLVSSLLGVQAGNAQTQIAATILKSNADAEKSTVLTLLGAAQQNSLANVGAGIGANVDISA
jgi:endonuclease/exonuclease/phosphatase (EEP) superfamily protein YafD